jgi:polysaccharide biosynthesis/export protein
MKQGRLLILALVWQSFFCPAQDNKLAGKTANVGSSFAGPARPDESAASAVSAVHAVASYLIGPSDVLTVTVWKQPPLSGSILVRPDGMISLPLLGDVPAIGMTPLELAEQLTTKLRKYIQDPNVAVVLTQINSKRVYLLGEVAKKGPVAMTPGMTLLEAIANAGGLTDYANAKKIYILRQEPGEQQKIPVHYKRALRGDSEADVALESGDTIVVP